MKQTKNTLIHFLQKHNISHTEFPVSTDGFPPPESFWTDRDILRCKNLFFRDNHGKNHYLVILNYYKELDIKKLQKITGRGSMTLASGWRLEKFLGLRPGFVSVFGLINDEEKHVQVVIDSELDQDKALSFLPNTEGGSFFALKFQGLIKFIESNGNHCSVVDL